MQPDALALLWDAREAATKVADFVDGVEFSDYEKDALVQSAVERQFTIVGEALNRLRKVDPDVAAAVPNLAQIVGFRNVLVHGYAEIENRRVWDTATSRVDELVTALQELLAPYE